MTESVFAFIIIAIISFVIIWAIVSIPVWISAKLLTSGPIVYALVLIMSTNFLSLTIGNRSPLIASVGLVLAFLAWIYVFKRGFRTGWIRGIGIALLAIFVLVVIGFA